MKARTTSVILIIAALFLVAVPAASAVPNGTYKGQDESELDLKIKVKKNRITKFEGSVYASCGLENFIITFAYPPAGKKGSSVKIKGNGTFKVVFKGSENVSYNDDKRTLKGKFTGGRVSGSMKIEGLCSADSTFTARK